MTFETEKGSGASSDRRCHHICVNVERSRSRSVLKMSKLRLGPFLLSLFGSHLYICLVVRVEDYLNVGEFSRHDIFCSVIKIKESAARSCIYSRGRSGNIDFTFHSAGKMDLRAARGRMLNFQFDKRQL